MKLKIAKIISTIGNPFLLFPVFQVIIYLALGSQSLVLLITSIGCQFVLPIVTILVLLKLGKISDFEISDRRQRGWYFLFVTGFFWLAALLTMSQLGYLWVNLVMAIYMSLLTIISLGWKISGHLLLDTVMILLLGIAAGPGYFLLLLGLPLVGWSRVVLKKHTIAQVIAGILLPFLTISIFMSFIYSLYSNFFTIDVPIL